MSNLEKHTKDHEDLGCTRMDRALGFAKMPPGYALMLDHDEAFYYGLGSDGVQSDVCWDKWAIYRWAKLRSIQNNR